LLHVIVLPALACVLCGVHFWRIRKDGGLNRPAGVDESEPEPETSRPVFSETSDKSYALVGIVKGRSPVVDRGPEHTVPSWPHLLYAEMLVLVLTTIVVLVLGYTLDAPLNVLANPEVPENPAKAPWYFLGLQELVSYSAFSGGLLIPTIVVIGLLLIPFLDREQADTGVWFSGAAGRRVAWRSAVFATVFVIGGLAFSVNYGWLRDWYPHIPQLVITFVNPGTLYVLGIACWSLYVTKRTDSTRLGAIAVFTCFLVAFAILTWFATFYRGPNWGFYWSRASWPVVH